jgi:hypothetical protein
MPAVDASVEVPMLRARSAFASVILAGLVLPGASGWAVAQTGCQPTIMQPCTNAPARPANPAPGQKRSTQADDDSNEPKDHSPRIPLDKDTTFQFGTGGIGLGRKF